MHKRIDIFAIAVRRSLPTFPKFLDTRTRFQLSASCPEGPAAPLVFKAAFAIESSSILVNTTFKTTPGFEKYLDEITCVKERTALTKFRISNSVLMIEKGRHQNIDKNLRFCPFCVDKVEDEKHFLIECPVYKFIRSDLYREVKSVNPSICNQPYSYRFLNLMRDTNTLPVSRFVSKAMELREYLQSKPKRHD